MTPPEAELLVEEKLGQSPRAAHSRQVGQILGALATHFAADVRLWTVVGLVHDIDYFAVGDDWTQHGVLAAAWLQGRLPKDALEAIAAHDRSTGVTSASLLADMLKLADALAILVEALGIEALARDDPFPGLRVELGGRSYLADIIETIAARHEIDLNVLRRIGLSQTR